MQNLSERPDDETGLIFFGHRYYAPSLGRWLTTNPAGVTDSMNLYAFVLNNPLKFMDHFGLAAENSSGTICYYESTNNVRVILNSRTEQIITIIPGAAK